MGAIFITLMRMLSFFKLMWDCVFYFEASVSLSLEGADAIIAHAGGENSQGEPGEINYFLAHQIRDICKSLGDLPIVAQGELAPCIPDLNLVATTIRQAESVVSGKGYIDTYQVARFHLEKCREMGFQKPILVSYHPHLWRAKKVSEKIGLPVLIPKIKAGVYDRSCSQIWMRSPWLNTPREILCRVFWALQGKI